MCSVGKAFKILYITIVVWLLDDHSGHPTLCYLRKVIVAVGDSVNSFHHFYFHSMEMGIGIHHFERLRIDSLRDEHLVSFLAGSHTHHHSLGRSSGAVVHRGV